MTSKYDLVVVGAGIVGLAHALIATRRGISVCVVDRESEAIGASVRNFGFVTVTGQQAGDCWRRARRSQEIWLEVAPEAGIVVEHEGLIVVAQRPEALAVLEAFRATDMGADCELFTAEQTRRHYGAVLNDTLLEGALYSPHERRVESRFAIPKLARWLEEAKGVTFRRRCHVSAVDEGRVRTSQGEIHGARVVVSTNDDLVTLFPEEIAALGIQRCWLQMLKVMPADPGFRLPAAVMSDLSLVRYLGYAELPEAAALRARLEQEQPQALANGVHLIAVQGADGGLIVGDSHHYGFSPSPFSSDSLDNIMLDKLHAVLRLSGARVAERWMGTYASLPDKLMVRVAPQPDVRLVIVTSGTGASTAFAIAEETLAELFGDAA
ncbi:TIGR03364 family FAD-dependent oxidoreductase [Aquabacter sp. L1I39]|uniref:TIGR03364 family FAD-dependent oxidoreductase n=1 Tax=Aquabacter sp. L1I39 TaxID=2820278 RepID=UPI001ADD15F1|nr:TIGR03364 family FAD-dependent oxidoreductase [Aquabacter sp. L1I39]QTL04782.1 TIGR03364 family FAD-dependent oxidoreductase [Aquabacter sp. L1I39]